MRLLFWWFVGIPVKGNGYETIVFCIVDDAGIIHTGADGEQGIKSARFWVKVTLPRYWQR